MNSFVKQIVSSCFTISIENFIPQYIVTESGDIVRHLSSLKNEDKSSFAGIKNPLFFFKEFLKNSNLK